MSKKPAARAPAPERNEALLAEAENPRPEPSVIWNKDGISPHRDGGGRRRLGRNEIDPASIPWDRSTPPVELGDSPLVEVMVVERSRDGSAWRYRHGRVVDPSVLKGLELDDEYDSEPVSSSANGLTMRIALDRFHQLLLNRLGVPALIEFIE